MAALNAGVKRTLDDDASGMGGKRQALGGELDPSAAFALKILVANKSAGSVIGKGGATINAIKESTASRVKVSSNQETFPGTNDRIVLIQGNPMAVQSAAGLVVAELFRDPVNAAISSAKEAGIEGMPQAEVTLTVTVVIPAQACGLIIGKGGERINHIRESTQAKIQMQSKDKAIPGINERTVSIQGNLLQCQMGVNAVATILFEDGTVHYENQSTNYGMAANAAMMGGGVQGLGGAALGGFGGQGMYGGMMGGGLGLDMNSFGSLPGQHAGMQQGGMSGGMGGDFGGAGQITMKLAIAETSVGILVGKAGCVIKELMQISGANIKVSQKGEVVPGTTNRFVSITGNPVAANYAQMLVLQKVPDATSV